MTAVSSTVTPADPEQPMIEVALPDVASAPTDADDRLRARARVFELVRASQLDGGLTAATVAEIIGDAERRGWSDLVKLGMYLGIIHSRYVDHETTTDWTERLLERAENEGDPVMTATALAVRSLNFDLDGGRAAVDADRDLARAIVLLDDCASPSSEAVSAHIECALSCDRRDLWELQLAHYEAAEACLEQDEAGRERLQSLRYNRAEVEVNWAAALRERGQVAELPDRAARARAALDAADGPLMPDSWREDLALLRELVDALAPAHGAAVAPRRPAVGEYAGYVHLARAFASAPGAQARAHIELALEAIDQQGQQRIYLLALALAVELEAAESGGNTFGLRWGRELVSRRWEQRLTALASMQSLVEVERLAAEHARLQQHAFLDDLTGLANRRGLARFTDGLRGRGVRSVAIALVDLDHFKLVNDGHGHAVGDKVLARIASILRSGVREQDLVARLGGDEFLLLFTLHDHEAARRRCETVVEAIASTGWGEVSEELSVAASLGIAFGSPEDFDDVCATADAALYRAKQAGGGRVCR
jgi:diguanylate cyclase (GGDEF)-like protein